MVYIIDLQIKIFRTSLTCNKFKSPCSENLYRIKSYASALALSLLLLFLAACGVSQTGSPQVVETSENRALELYGMEYINDSSDYSVVKDFGVDTIVIEFSAYQSEDKWLAKLDEAAARDALLFASHR